MYPTINHFAFNSPLTIQSNTRLDMNSYVRNISFGIRKSSQNCAELNKQRNNFIEILGKDKREQERNSPQGFPLHNRVYSIHNYNIQSYSLTFVFSYLYTYSLTNPNN
jgi:hypothetical protein